MRSAKACILMSSNPWYRVTCFRQAVAFRSWSMEHNAPVFVKLWDLDPSTRQAEADICALARVVYTSVVKRKRRNLDGLPPLPPPMKMEAKSQMLDSFATPLHGGRRRPAARFKLSWSCGTQARGFWGERRGDGVREAWFLSTLQACGEGHDPSKSTGRACWYSESAYIDLPTQKLLCSRCPYPQ